MSEKTIYSKQLIYLGIGRNKDFCYAPNISSPPIEFFPYGLFLRFSQDTEKIQGLIYDFLESPAEKSLLPKQRKILLESQYFGRNCYIDCYFKKPDIIYSFLEEFNQTFIFMESGSNILINKELLTERIQSLGMAN